MFERNPFWQLLVGNIRLHLREPEAIFWTYGFPLLMVTGLGLAFSSSGEAVVYLDAVSGPAAERVQSALADLETFEVTVHDAETAFTRLRGNQTPLVVTLDDAGVLQFHFDPSNPEGLSSKAAAENALQSAAGRQDPLATEEVRISAPGSRYVDFLVPGLIGMNLMGGGMWGIGFVLVDMRIKKLLKRLLGTPMSRSQFLLSVVGNRVIFFIPEAFCLLLLSALLFGVPIEGSIASIILVCFIGAMAFAGLGLLAASRAKRIETISGILNVVMLPMWLCSGVFFSSERFPDWMQPFVQALPLTQLVNALRAVILEGQGLTSQWFPLMLLMVWALAGFGLALKWFRWN